MTRDGRGNDSFDPRCYRCGHTVGVHRKGGCDGPFEPCDCTGYAKDDAEAAQPATTLDLHPEEHR